MTPAKIDQLLGLRRRREHKAREALAAQMARERDCQATLDDFVGRVDVQRRRQAQQAAALDERLGRESLGGQQIAIEQQRIAALDARIAALINEGRQVEKTLKEIQRQRERLAATLRERQREVLAIETLEARQRSQARRRVEARAEDEPGLDLPTGGAYS